MRISWPHILVLVLVVVVLFGASRLPDVARNLGKSMKILKDEVKDLRDEPAAPPVTDQPVVDRPVQAPVTDRPVADQQAPNVSPSSPYQPGGARPDLPNQPRP